MLICIAAKIGKINSNNIKSDICRTTNFLSVLVDRIVKFLSSIF